MSGSKQALEELIGRTVDTFAYPSARMTRVCAGGDRRGLRSAAAVKNALSHREDDPWAIARWTVEQQPPARSGSPQVLDGRGAPYAWRAESGCALAATGPRAGSGADGPRRCEHGIKRARAYTRMRPPPSALSKGRRSPCARSTSRAPRELQLPLSRARRRALPAAAGARAPGRISARLGCSSRSPRRRRCHST